jgi:hypothetical protein
MCKHKPACIILKIPRDFKFNIQFYQGTVAPAVDGNAPAIQAFGYTIPVNKKPFKKGL